MWGGEGVFGGMCFAAFSFFPPPPLSLFCVRAGKKGGEYSDDSGANCFRLLFGTIVIGQICQLWHDSCFRLVVWVGGVCWVGCACCVVWKVFPRRA